MTKDFRHIPFNRGLQDKASDILSPDGAVDALQNVVFRKDGDLDLFSSFLEVDDEINAQNNIKALYSVVDDELFAFTDNGTWLKKGSSKFQQISEANLFDNESFFVSREEEPIHNPTMRLKDGILLYTYQTKTGSSAQVNFYLLDQNLQTFITRGVLTEAKDPICFITNTRRGFLYKALNNDLMFYDIDRKSKESIRSTLDEQIKHTDTDTTDIVRIGDDEYLWVTKGWNSTAQRNQLIAYRFNVNNRKAFVRKELTIAALGSREDLGRVFMNRLSDVSNTIEICITTKIGLQSAEIEVYQYQLDTDEFAFVFSENVVNSLDNEIIGVFADVDENRIIYHTSGADVRILDPNATPTDRRLFDTFVIIDFFILDRQKYYLVANRNAFFVIDKDYRLVCKLNNDHLNTFGDIRRTRVDVQGDKAYLPTPRLTSIEGFTERGFSSYYNVLSLDKDQDRECERFGQYYLITSSPLSFYDKREVVEYGFAKKPQLTLDSVRRI